MALKIEQVYNKMRVTWIGQHFKMDVSPEQLMNTIAHYYAMPEHKPQDCPVCKKITAENRKRHGKKG